MSLGSGMSSSAPSGGDAPGGAVAVAEPAPAGAPAADVPGNWSLQERQYWQKLQEEIDSAVAQLNERCGAQISATYVHESFRGRMTEGGSYGLDGYTRATCDAPIEAMFSMCTNSEMAKQAIQQTVRRLECDWGATHYALSDGTIRFRFNTDEQNAASYQDQFESWLEQNL
jgi:hypothetical protein